MELLDIYDDNGNRTGKTVVRGDKTAVLNEHEHIAVAVIFLENDNHEFLIQKTSKEKGGKFSSTGGHINSGETPLETIKREVKEELGIDVSNDPIKEYGFLCYDKPLRYLFYLKKNIDINSINLQQEEVESIEYMNLEKINQIIEQGKMLESHAVMFKELMKKDLTSTN